MSKDFGLQQFVNATDKDLAYINICESTAKELLQNELGKKYEEVPENILFRAHLEVGADLFNRRKSRAGVVEHPGTDFGGATPVKVARDSLRSVREMLRPWLGGGFA